MARCTDKLSRQTLTRCCIDFGDLRLRFSLVCTIVLTLANTRVESSTSYCLPIRDMMSQDWAQGPLPELAELDEAEGQIAKIPNFMTRLV